MAKDYSLRTCGGASNFNSGVSRCSVPREKIKGLILVPHGVLLPSELSVANLEKFFHEDRPNRGFPIRIIDEFAPSGGEAQVSQQGYGANKITGYSARTDTFTLDKFDSGLRANVVEAKNMQFDVYYVNQNNIIFGQDGNSGEFKGIPLSGVYVGGQDYDSSGQVANLTISLVYTDIEKHLKLEAIRQVDFDILSVLDGLVEVEFKKIGTNTYKLAEAYGGLDITEYFGQSIAAGGSTVITNLNGSTTITYEDGVLTIPTKDAEAPKLAKPSILSTKGISGIEQIGTYSGTGGGGEIIDPGA